MAETKTESLTDVLRELAELAPKRFAARKHSAGFWFNLGSGSIRLQDGGSECARALILAACMEECEARGWIVQLRFDASWNAEIIRPFKHRFVERRDLDRIHKHCADSPALALATALRDAIKAT